MPVPNEETVKTCPSSSSISHSTALMYTTFVVLCQTCRSTPSSIGILIGLGDNL